MDLILRDEKLGGAVFLSKKGILLYNHDQPIPNVKNRTSSKVLAIAHIDPLEVPVIINIWKTFADSDHKQTYYYIESIVSCENEYVYYGKHDNNQYEVTGIKRIRFNRDVVVDWIE